MTMVQNRAHKTEGEADEKRLSPASTKIVHAAELEFAEKGFDGAGMKALAQRAGVSQSLLHYHFRSKDQLYTAVIRERSKLINAERLARLHAVDLDQPEALANIFAAFFLPALGPAGGGRAYARIFAGLIAGNERDQALVREFYDPTAQKFIDAIALTLPGSDRAAAAQIYQFALGVLASVISRDGRADRLGGSKIASLDNALLVDKLTRFAVGGAKALTN